MYLNRKEDMRRKKRSISFTVRIIFWPVLMLALTLPVMAKETVPPDKPLPKALMGIWRITNVLVDTGTIRWLHVQRDDPNLMGNLIYISPQRILAYVDKIGYSCKNPSMIVQHTTAGALIKDTMGGRVDPPIHPTAQDYELPFKQDDPVTVMWVKGFGGWDIGTADGTWLLMLPDGRLAARWSDGSIVVFSRQPADTKPVASFDCAKARTAEEKTICGSIELALLDCDVSSWYISALKSLEGRVRLEGGQIYLDAIKALKKSQ